LPSSLSPSSLSLRLALFYTAYFVIMGLHLPYWPAWLEARGLGPEEISLVLGLGMVVRMVAGPAAGRLIDLTGDRKRAGLVIGALATASFAAFLLLPGQAGLAGILALYLLAMSFFPALLPLVDTVTSRAARAGEVDYGRVRLWGSLSFIAASVLGGVILERIGAGAILPAVVLACAVTWAAAFLLPRGDGEQNAAAEPDEDKKTKKGGAAQLLRHPLFVLFLVAAPLIQASHAVYYNFSVVHWTKQGLSGEAIGLLWGWAVVVEIALFAVAGRYIERFGPLPFLIAGAAASIIRWAAMMTDPGLAALIPLQALHALSFGAAHLGAIAFVARAVPHHLAATGQALYAALASGGTLGLAMLLSGPAYRAYEGLAYGVGVLFALGALIGCTVLWRLWSGDELRLASKPASSAI